MDWRVQRRPSPAPAVIGEEAEGVAEGVGDELGVAVPQLVQTLHPHHTLQLERGRMSEGLEEGEDQRAEGLDR